MPVFYRHLPNPGPFRLLCIAIEERRSKCRLLARFSRCLSPFGVPLATGALTVSRLLNAGDLPAVPIGKRLTTGQSATRLSC